MIGFIPCVRIAIMVALQASLHVSPHANSHKVLLTRTATRNDTIVAPPPLTPAEIARRKDWKRCATIDVSGKVMDTVWHPLAGVWAQSGDAKNRQLIGSRVKTDTAGIFRLTVNPAEARTIYLFADSSMADMNQSIGSYGLGAFRIYDCVANPPFIKVVK